ncbi:MFS transporter [Flavobacterium agricola]|uniref:MFS transporter n=1 Tax=Flavobacterium agricola TaxID=2870839 RepID=A0ABY6LYU0_9FLAO|nr:MFS transporter [Flavobacterium agricola]UYW01451.1 MFS transporter [Flavobacterium agricola]
MTTYKHLPRIAVTILFFVFGGISASWASRIPTIKDYMQVNDAAWGFVLLFIAIGTLITLPFASWIIKQLGSKKATVLFLISYLILLVGIGYWNTLWQLKLNLIAFGAISNLTNISINTQAINVAKNYKSQIIGSFHGTWSIGGFFASWIGAEMIGLDVLPLKHFIYFSSFGIVVALVMFRYLIPDQPNTLEKEVKSGFIMPDKNLIILGLLSFFALLSEGTMTDWASEYMKQIVKSPTELIGYGLTAYMFAMASGRFLSDFTVKQFGPKATLSVCGVLIFIGLSLSVLFPSVYTTIIAFMIVGLGTSAIVPMVYDLAGKSKVMPTQQALTLITSIGFIGFFLGPPIIGFVAEAWSLKVAFAVIAIFGLAISLLSRITKYSE